MSDFTYDLGGIESHANNVKDIATEIETTASQLASKGVGDPEMYGMALRFIAHLIANSVAIGDAHGMGLLADLVDGLGGSLSWVAQNYRATEQSHVQLIDSFVSQIGNE